MPLQPGKYTIGPEDIEPHVDENTIGVAAVVGTTFTGHADDVVGMNDFLVDLKDRKGLDVHAPHRRCQRRLRVALPVSALRVGLPPRAGAFDQRLGAKFGLVYPGIGWLIFREKADLAEDLVFYENYLGKTDATFTLNFSTGSSMVIAQYYNFVLSARRATAGSWRSCRRTRTSLAKDIEGIGKFEIIGAARRRCRWSPSTSPRSIPTTSSTSRSSWPPSAAGWCRPTRCPRTPTT